MKKFFNYILLIVALSFSNLISTYAQGNDMSNIRKLKMEIVLNEMKLDQATEKKFTPLYNKYSDETLVLRKKIKEVEASNKAPQAIINEREQLKQQILNIEKRYKTDFLKIISAAELEKMYRGENKFRSTLLELKKSK